MMSLHKCSRCQKKKPASEFHKSNTRKAGVQRYCKECKRLVDRNGKKAHNGKYIVYYLPKERYVGMTQNYRKRMYKHKIRGRNTRGSRILLITGSSKLAHLLETLLHLVGYKGFRY